nr:immunoglobulin heavy chain junction region [Mus musculus]
CARGQLRGFDYW